MQGYVEFTTQVGFNALKKRFPKVHWEARKGTSTQAADYCRKEGTDIFEEGSISKAGKRTDLDKVRAQLQGDDASLRTIVETATSTQSVRFAEIYLKFKEKQRDFKPTVTWLYGPTGLGKTYRATMDAKAKGHGDDIHYQTDNCKWWDGYDGHKVVIIDDIRDTFCSYVRILNLLDRYPCRIECKGGSRQFLARHIYITSPNHPAQTWATIEDKEQLLRRLDNIEQIISLTQSIVEKGYGVPNYQEEDIQEETDETQSKAGSGSEFSYQEVRTESDA